MIIKENIKINNKKFIKQHSDKEKKKKKVGTEEIYSEAIDPIEFEREYIETDVPIEEEGDINEKN